MKNYYEILEISENASPEIIEKSYRVLAKKYHPNIQPRDKLYWAEVNFKEITEAYQVLSNKVLKKEYDMQLKAHILQNQNYNYSQYAQQQNVNDSYSEYQDDDVENTTRKSKLKKKKNSIIALNTEVLTSLKEIISNIPRLIREETQKPKEERTKSLKAFILTIILVSIIIFVFVKVPFLNKLLFP